MAFAEYPVVSSSGSGGITKVADSIERNALTPADGDIVIQLDNDFLYEWNGSSWAVLADRTWQTAGSILGAKTFDTASRWSVATNQLVLGVTNTTTINSVAPSASRIYTIPDAGADASFVLTAGTQSVGGSKTFTSAVTVSASSNQVILHSGVNQLTLNSGTSAAARTYTVPDTGTTDTFAMLGGTQSFTGAKTFSSTITATNSSAPLTLNVGSSSNAELLFTSSATQPDLYINFRSTGTGPQSWLLGLNPSGISSNAFGLWDNTAGAPIFTTEQTTNVTTYYANVTINNASNQLSLSSSVNLLNLNSGTSAAARTYTFPDVGTTGTFAMLQGSQTFAGAKTFSSAVTVSAASNQLVLSSGVNQLTLNSSTSAAARTYAFPDVGTSGTVAMLEGAQTFSGLKTFSSGLAISGGSAANNTIWVASNTLNIRGGTSGTDIYNTSGNVVVDITDAGAVSVPTATTHIFGNSSGAATTAVVVEAANTQQRDVIIRSGGTTHFGLRVNTSNACYLISNSQTINFSGDAGTTVHGSMTSAGVWTLGATSGSSKHTIRASASTVLAIDNTTVSAQASQIDFNKNGVTKFTIGTDNSSYGTDGFFFYNGAALVGGTTQAGAWTLGPSTPGTLRHSFNGNIRLAADGSFQSGDNFRFASNTLHIYGGTSGLIFLDSGNVSVKGSMSDAGAWTLGPSGADAVDHTIRGTTKLYRATATATSYIFYAHSNVGGTDLLKWRVEADGDTISATNSYTSDLRVKKNVAPIQYGLAEILQLDPMTFNWKHESDTDTKSFSVGSAQLIQQIMPEMVRDDGLDAVDDEGNVFQTKSVYTQEVMAVLVKAIQELHAELQAAKAEIALLRGV